jgi:hypothetical protein
MTHAIFGTFPIVYPPAAAYFDSDGTCALKDERCGGPIKVHAYFYLETEAPPGPDGIPDIQPFPSAAELMLADGLD